MGQTPLYRTEVIEARRNRWLGALLLRQPLSHWVLTWVAVAIAFGIGATLYWGEYTRRVRVVGELVSGKDDATLQALLSIPESALASARIGGDVQLRYPAFPHQRYGKTRGRIVDIAPADPARRAAADAGPRQDMYVALVEIATPYVSDGRGHTHALRTGLNVEADLIVDRRRLYAWLFEPLAPRAAAPAASGSPAPSTR